MEFRRASALVADRASHQSMQPQPGSSQPADADDCVRQALAQLKTFFGYNRFRPGQVREPPGAGMAPRVQPATRGAADMAPASSLNPVPGPRCRRLRSGLHIAGKTASSSWPLAPESRSATR
jgi:hypothetical protein